MSTKESVHSARSGHSAHSNEESLLVDNQQGGNQKKKLICAGIVMAVMLICMGVAIFFAVYQMKGLDDAKAQKDELIKKRDQMIKKKQDQLTNKVLNLNNLNLKDLTITIGKQGASKIKELHLLNNKIEQFNSFNLPNLQKLSLDGNPLTHFRDNTFESLKTISLPGNTIVDFDNNYIPHIQTLDMSQHVNLTSFEDNKLDDLTYFAITQSLIDFTGNYLPKTSAFNISSFTSIKKFFGNYINLDILYIESQTLEQFYNNTFPTITNATIFKSNLQYVYFNNCSQLQTLTIDNSLNLKTLMLYDLPKLKYLNLEAPALVQLQISNINITQFPMKQSNLRYDNTVSFSSIERLILKQSPIKNCNLTTFTNLKNLVLQDLYLEEINLINGENNLLEKIWFGNLRLQNFSEYYFRKVTQFVLSNNLNLHYFSNNSMPILRQFKIIGTSELTQVKNNSFPDLKTFSLIDTNDVKKIFASMSNRQTQGIQLRNNNLRNNDIDFKSLLTLKRLKIYDNPITDLVLQNKNLVELDLGLEQLNSLRLTNTAIKGINQLGESSFNLKTPLLKQLIIQQTPIQSFIKLNLPELTTLVLNQTKINDFSSNNFPLLVNFTIVNAPVYVIDISNMKHLQNLHIQNSDIISLTEVILPSITSLTLYNNTYLDIFDSTYFPNLIDFRIKSQVPTGIDTIILNNSKLQSFSGYQLQYLINLIIINNPTLNNITNNKFPYLQTLHIQNATLTDYQQNQFGSLKTIFFKDVPLQIVLPQLLDLTIEQIHLENNKIQKFNISNYKNLKVFHSYGNPIIQMNVNDLIYLQNFQIDSTELKQLKISNTSIVNYKILSNKLDYLLIENSPIQTFKNNSFAELDDLLLINTHLNQFVNNNLPFIQRISIVNTPYLQTIYLQRYDYIRKLELNNMPKLQKIITDISFDHIASIIIKNIGFAEIDTSNFTSLNNLELEGEFKKIVIANSQLTSFSNHTLNTLEHFVLRNNSKLTQFQDNTFKSARKLEITNTNLTESQNNDFPLLAQVIIKSSSGDISNLLASFKHENVISLTLSQVSVPESFQISSFVKLDSLVLQKLNMTNLALANLPLTFIRLTLPILQQLTLSNITVKDYLFEGVPLLKNLIIDRCPQLPRFQNETLPQLISLSLTNNQIVTVFNNSFPKLQQFILEDLKTQTINVIAPKLVKFSIQTPALKTLNLDAPIQQITLQQGNVIQSITLTSVLFSQYQINNYPQLINLSIKSPTLNTLTISESPHLTSIINSLLPNLTTLSVIKSSLTDLTNFSAEILTTLQLRQSSALSFTLPVLSNKLVNLTLDKVQIASLNLESYPQLSKLQVKSQKLTQLNIHNNPNLKTLQQVNLVPVVSLTVINTGIIGINNVQFTNLQHLYISGNKLNSFQINTMPKLVNLTFIDDNIVQLQIIFESVLTYWLINCQSLKALTIQDAPFKLVSNVSAPNLQQLSLSHMQLTDQNPIQHFPKLNTLVIENSNIITINLANFPLLNTLQFTQCSKLKKIVNSSQTLQNLLIVNSPELQSLPLVGFTNLKSLYLISIPNINQPSVAFLSKLEKLTFKDVNITDLSQLNMTNIKTISIEDSGVSNFGQYNWTNLESVLLDNVKVTKFQCISPNLKYLTVKDTPLQFIQFSSFEQLQQIMFEKINIQKFNNQTLPNLKKLTMENIDNLDDFQQNKFDKLQQLDITNAMKIKSFNSKFPNLKNLNLNNLISYNEPFDYDNYQSLTELSILATSINEARFGYPIQTVTIGNNDQKCNLSLVIFNSNNSIKQFNIYNTQIKNISNTIMNNLEQLDLRSNQDLQQFQNNTFSNLKTLDLSNTKTKLFLRGKYQKLTHLDLSHSSLQQFKQNTLPALDILNIKNAINLKTFEQQLPNLSSLDLEINALTQFPNIKSLLKKIKTLNLKQSQSLTTVSNQQSSTLQTLDISINETSQETIFTFQSNKFNNLINLNLKNCNIGSFSNNELIKLKNLFLDNNANIIQQQLMQQIEKEKTPKLELLSIIGCNISQASIDQIRERYTNITIITNE